MLHTRVINLDGSGHGTIGVPPSRLAALEGGTVTNRTHTLAPGDRLPNAEEFVAGECTAVGAPDGVCTLWLHYPGT